MSNVVPFVVKPKEMQRSYKRQNYTVTYIPASKEWRWTVEFVQVTTYSEVCDTQVKAFRAAERHIDKCFKNMGRAV